MHILFGVKFDGETEYKVKLRFKPGELKKADPFAILDA